MRKTDVIAVHDFRDVWENFGAEVIPAEVLYDDGHVLVVNKPTGCTVTRERHSGNCPFRNGILLYARSADWGERALAERYRPRTVHRIDRETSGAVIIATSREGELHLGGQFNDRALVKEYLAVVHGEVLDESGEIDVPIAPDARDVGRMQVGGRTAKRALTRYEIAERYRGFTLLRVFLETGRRHQIRVHLSEIGHPRGSRRNLWRRPAPVVADQAKLPPQSPPRGKAAHHPSSASRACADLLAHGPG